MTLSDVEWDACVLEPRHDRELESYMRRELGAVPSAVPYFTASPWLVRSMASLTYYGAPLVHLSYVLADLVGLVVSQDNSCRYCYGDSANGDARARVARGANPPDRAELPRGRDRAAHEARARVRSAHIARARRSSRVRCAAARAAGWEPQALRELAYQSAYHVFMNRLMTMAAIPVAPVERQAEHWVLGWIAPVARLVMRRRWRTRRRHAASCRAARRPVVIPRVRARRSARGARAAHGARRDVGVAAPVAACEGARLRRRRARA